MFSIPHSDVLSRTIDAAIQPTVNHFASLIDGAVNLGTNIFASDINPASKAEDNITPTMLFRHFIDLLDSLSILIRASSADPSKLVLRGAFEVLLQLEYLFESNTDKRAMDYLFCDILNQIKVLERNDPNTQIGKMFQASLICSKNIVKTDNGKIDNIRKQIKIKRALLDLKQFATSKKNYEDLKANKVPKRPWYRFDSDFESIEKLAKHLNRGLMYELYYRDWSGSTHGTDVYLGKIIHNTTQSVDIVGLRSPAKLQEITLIALTFSLIVFEIYIKSRVPQLNHSFVAWKSSIADDYGALKGKQLIKSI